MRRWHLFALAGLVWVSLARAQVTWVQQPSPTNIRVEAGTSVEFTFTVRVPGTGGVLRVLEYKDGNGLSGPFHITQTSVSIVPIGTEIHTQATFRAYNPRVEIVHAGIYHYQMIVDLTVVGPPSQTTTLQVRPTSPPSITQHPVSRSVMIGGAVTFSVAATGVDPIRYQWLKGTTYLPATTNTLTLTNVQPADADRYWVKVTNPGGLTESAEAELTVVYPGPGITQQPVSQMVSLGETATFAAMASGSELTYQWRKDGVNLPGATSSTLLIQDVAPDAVGMYAVVVTNPAGTVISDPVELRMRPNITQQPAGVSVVAGESALLEVRTIGSAPLTYQWRKDGAPISGATTTSLRLSDLQLTDQGSYTVTVTNDGGAVMSAPASVVVAPAVRVANLSVRANLNAGQKVIAGFVMRGGPADVLLRAAGPSLSQFGVSGAMADPHLDVYGDDGVLTLANNDWSPVLSSGFSRAGAFPFTPGSRDAAVVQTVTGSSAVHVSGAGSGVVVVEAFAFEDGVRSELINVSARNHVGTGDNVLIAGISVTGNGIKRLLVRAVGPTLSNFGVVGFLADPVLTVTTNGEVVASNDDWDPSVAPVFEQVGAFSLPSGTRDAAATIAVRRGSYTVQVAGVNGATGEALVEIYVIP